MKNLIKLYMLSAVIIVAIVGQNYISAQMNLEKSSRPEVVIYNWGDYIDPELITQFEEEYNYNVVYETFESNESMYIKIQNNASNYDLAFPSEYTVDKMIKNDLVMPIDYSQIEGFDNLDPAFLNQPFDANNKYSIPYFWGTVGIVYNQTILDEVGVEEVSCFNDLWDEKLENNILLVDGARETLGMSLNSMNQSLNSTDDIQLNLALEKLLLMKNNIKGIVGDEIKSMMVNEEAAIAMTWSGDAQIMIDENEDLDYAIPCEGTNIWVDNMVIPTTSKNQQGAYDFINFMLKPEIQAINTEYVGYSTPNIKTQELLEDIAQDERFYPSSEVIANQEYYLYIGEEGMNKYNELFLKLKMEL